MKRLSHLDGTWQQLQDQWREQCLEYDEDYSAYIPDTLQFLADQIDDCHNERWSGVYSHHSQKDEIEAICFLNGAHIPGFSGRVLRTRHLILAPKYDLGSYSAEDYARLLSEVFEDLLVISSGELECPHVKIHFRSPADVELFRSFATHLNRNERFSDVKMVGSRLFVSKA